MIDATKVKQGSANWFTVKIGKASASRAGDIMSRVKPSAKNPNGYGAPYKKYQRELLIERLTGIPTRHYTTPEMEWGIELEEQAALAYEANNGVMLQTCGFYDHPTIPMCGASPDRLIIGQRGLVEIKDPATGTHLETILDGTYDEDYLYQMAWQKECVPDIDWVDFVSFDIRLAPNLRYFQERFEPPEALLVDMREKFQIFLAELDALEAKVRAYSPRGE
jgi:hypothetical protein